MDAGLKKEKLARARHCFRPKKKEPAHAEPVKEKQKAER
jgi:hypothetical protein